MKSIADPYPAGKEIGGGGENHTGSDALNMRMCFGAGFRLKKGGVAL